MSHLDVVWKSLTWDAALGNGSCTNNCHCIKSLFYLSSVYKWSLVSLSDNKGSFSFRMYFVYFAVSGAAVLTELKCKQIYEELIAKPW